VNKWGLSFVALFSVFQHCSKEDWMKLLNLLICNVNSKNGTSVLPTTD